MKDVMDILVALAAEFEGDCLRWECGGEWYGGEAVDGDGGYGGGDGGGVLYGGVLVVVVRWG